MSVRFIRLLVAATICAEAFTSPAAPARQAARKTKGELENSLTLLNQWGQQPELVNQLYTAAYQALAASTNASFPEVANDPAVQRICKEAGIRHLGGPMLGSVEATGVRVWLRTLQPANVEVRVMVGGVEKAFGPVRSSAETDLSAVVPVTGLMPGTRYPYRVLIDGQAIEIPQHAVIATAPDPEKQGKVRIAFGSCYHRWGIGNPKQAATLRTRAPAAFLTIGDIAVQDRLNNLGMHRADYLLRDFQPAWQGLVCAIPVFATWDDHDYFRNDGFGIPKGFTREDQMNVREVFRRSWNNPSYGFEDARGGVFLRTRIGPCDVIMVDERYFRTGDPGSFLGPDQMKWLEAALLSCKGPFIILSSGTMWSDYVSGGKDSWGKWDPQGREHIFSLIEKHRIGGVLLISGDRHGARGFRIPRPSGFSFYEFEAASLGARSGPPVTIRNCKEQFYGIAEKYAFGEFTMDTTRTDPEVEFRLVGEDGTFIHEMKLTRSQLTPPANSAGAAPNTLSEQERAEGWQLLWDGKTTEGWRSVRSDAFPASGWSITNGVLTVQARDGEAQRGGDIITRKRFSSFELTADFKLTPGANSGIKLFAQTGLSPKEKKAAQAVGLEFQLLDDALHPDAKRGKDGDRTVGSLYDLIPAAKNKKVLPVGEWNHARILSRGTHMEFWLNGEKTVEFDRGSAEFRKLVAGSKFKDIRGFGEASDGPILLQDHGNEVSFRNLKLRELTPK